MAELPTTLDEAIARAREATRAALDDGHRLVQIELVFPELKAQPIAEQFLPVLSDYGEGLRIFFPDMGAAALAKRDWGDMPFQIDALSSRRVSVEEKIQPEDRCFLVIEPSSVEVNEVEKLYRAAEDRPVILLLPRLESVATVGIGLAARQLRERFLSKIESCYYVRPLEGAALSRCYPEPWQVWIETEQDGYQCVAELPRKPVGEELDRILTEATMTPEERQRLAEEQQAQQPPQPRQRQGQGFFAEIQKFLRALSQ